KVREIFTQITEDEPQEDKQPITPIEKKEESTQSAPIASYEPRRGDPSDDYEAHVRQFNSTRISDFQSSKPWAVFVEGNRRTGGRLSTTNIYDFATLEEAKASVTYHVGHCSGATVYG